MKRAIILSTVALAIVTGCAPFPAPQLPTRNFARAPAVTEAPANQISYADFKEGFNVMRELGKEARRNQIPTKEAHDIAITAADQLIAQDSNAHFSEITKADYFSSDQKNALLKAYMETFFDGYNGK